MKQGVKAVIMYYGNSIPDALRSAFPHIGLDLERFPYQLSIHFYFFLKMYHITISLLLTNCTDYYNKMENQVRFFQSYAQANGFDPLFAENWYLQSHHKLTATKVHFIILSSSLFCLTFNNRVLIEWHFIMKEVCQKRC